MAKVNSIVVAFTQSPRGNRCIGMTVGEKTYLLLTVKQGPLADGLRKELRTQFHTESLPGIPLDWQASLAQDELIFLNKSGAIGIYVQEDKFDELTLMFSNL